MKSLISPRKNKAFQRKYAKFITRVVQSPTKRNVGKIRIPYGSFSSVKLPKQGWASERTSHKESLLKPIRLLLILSLRRLSQGTALLTMVPFLMFD